MPLNKNLDKERKNIYTIYGEQLKAVDGNVVEGFIATGHLDLVHDIVTDSCMVDMMRQLKGRSIKLDLEHESFRGKGVEKEINKTLIPVAKIAEASLEAKGDTHGIRVRSPLNEHHSRFNEVKGSIEDGYLDAYSIAYIPVEVSFEMKDGKKVRKLHKVNLLNVALTGNPVNPESKFTNVMFKSLEDFAGGIAMTEEKKDETPEDNKESEEESSKVEAKALAGDVKELSKNMAELKSVVEKLVEKKDEEKGEDEGSEKEVSEMAELKEQFKSIVEKQAEIDKVLSAPNFKARAEPKNDAEFKGRETKGPVDYIR